jgi:hypothetical protein
VAVSARIAATAVQGWRAASICFMEFLLAITANAYILAGAVYVALLFDGVITLD